MCAHVGTVCQGFNIHHPNHNSVSSGTLVIYHLAIWKNKRALICSICSFLWCKYSRHGQLPAPNGMSPNTELGRNALNWFYKPVGTHSSTPLPGTEVYKTHVTDEAIQKGGQAEIHFFTIF